MRYRVFKKITAILFCFSFSVIGAEPKGEKYAVWTVRNLSVENTELFENRIDIHLKDQNGKGFSVSYKNEPSEDEAGALLSLRDAMLGWSFVDIEGLRFLIDEKSIEAHLIPSRFECSSRDVVSNIPGGIFLRQTDALEYNFRVTQANYFIRIAGVFLDAKELCQKVLTAIDEPQLHKRGDNSDATRLKLEEMEKKIERSIFETRRVKYALAAMQNKSFFGCLGAPRPPDKKLVDRIVELKSDQPYIKRSDLMGRLVKEGYSVTEKELSIILQVYYNDFE